MNEIKQEITTNGNQAVTSEQPLCPIAYWSYSRKRDFMKVLLITEGTLPEKYRKKVENFKYRGQYRIQAFDIPYDLIREINDRVHETV